MQFLISYNYINRYACKLTLDEIFSSTNFTSKHITIDGSEQEEEIFTQLNQFEKDYQFCSPQEIPVMISYIFFLQFTCILRMFLLCIILFIQYWIQQNSNHIITMHKSEEKSVMRILHYEPNGVEFKLGQLDQFT